MEARRTIAIALVLSSLFYFTGVRAADDARAAKVAWAQSLGLDRLSDIGGALLKEQRQPLVLNRHGESRTIQNCDDYLSAVSDGFVPANNFENTRSSDYVERCFALQFLLQVSPSADVGVIQKWPEGMVASIPPLLCPAECGGPKAREWKAALDNGTPWVKWDPDLVVEPFNGRTAVLHDAEGWVYSMSLVVQSDSPVDQSQRTREQRFGILACASVQQGAYHECKFVVLSPDGLKLRQIYSRP